MDRKALLLILCLMTIFRGPAGFTQGSKLKATLVGNASDTPVSLFKTVDDPFVRAAYEGATRQQQVLQLDRVRLKELETSRPEELRLVMPGQDRRVLLLEQVQLLAPGFEMRTGTGERFVPADVLTYHGRLEDDESSIASVTIFDGELQVMYSDTSDNFRVQKSANQYYLHFRDADIIEEPSFNCETADKNYLAVSDEIAAVHTRSTSNNCVLIYVEIDYESYQDHGSDLNVLVNWVLVLFNETARVFDQHGITIRLSSVLAWNVPGPYFGLTSSSQFINTFKLRMDTVGFNGDIGHLISTTDVQSGIAYTFDICSSSPLCYSGGLSPFVSNNIPFPYYSWTIMVLAHEMGHVMGSPHTHACAWNGDFTTIDDCGSYSDFLQPCFEYPGKLPSAGTIMSYCHKLGGIGISLAKGFAPQPSALITNAIANASCSLGGCSALGCVTINTPADGDTLVEIGSVIDWSPIFGAAGYYIMVGSSAGASDIIDTIDLGDETETILEGLPFSTLLYVTVVPYNASQGVQGGCSSLSFATEPFESPGCTQVNVPSNGATDVSVGTTLSWAKPTGTPPGYVLSLGTTPGGEELYSEVAIGPVTSWRPPEDFPVNTTLYAKVRPSQPDTLECQEISFITGDISAGDICATATTIHCGTTVVDSTIGASADLLGYCLTSNTSAGVWFKFVGDGSFVTFSMCNQADFDTKLSIYSGTCDALTCLAARDDVVGCGLTSAVATSTIPGVQYYVLVHGYQVASGNFALTMACSNVDFCTVSSINSSVAWISEVEIGAVSIASEPTIYSNFTDIPLSVTPGSTHPVQITTSFDGSPSNVYYRVFIDMNKDGFFEFDEVELDVGPVPALLDTSLSFPANMSNDVFMRVAMSTDGPPVDCGFFYNGEVEDYLLSNGVCLQVVNKNASGPGSLLDAISCAQANDTITFHQSLDGDTIMLESVLTIGKNLCVMTDGVSPVTINASNVDRALNINVGSNVVLAGMRFVGGSANSGSGISNFGSLTLRDIQLEKSDDSSGPVLFNALSMTFEGAIEIRE